LLCIKHWPRTHYVAQGDLQLSLGLWTCSTMPDWRRDILNKSFLKSDKLAAKGALTTRLSGSTINWVISAILVTKATSAPFVWVSLLVPFIADGGDQVILT
jgi:hypothetical protein